VLTLAYCRVSTEEQAEEGFSIDGQADKLRAYSALRDLGQVTVIADPGLSGKNMQRPGLQQVLAAVEAGHVSHVLVWRLDRLSRNLGDLILLADLFGSHEVALHSINENLDLSSAAGRMFYNVLGSFAQYFREQLGENVKMGNERAIKEGKWINRPKTGYDLVGGELVPNDDAPRVVETFRLRALGSSLRQIEELTSLKYSTIGSILKSRIYLGEVLHNGEWSPGRHVPIISEEEWRAANRGFVPGRGRGSDVLSGKVLCGMCGRRMALANNGQGRVFYRCRHRGKGCSQPARTSSGLAKAVVLGFELLARDQRLVEAIRRNLAAGGRPDGNRAGRRRRTRPGDALATLSSKRRKLLDLYYRDGISPELFAEEEARLSAAIESVRVEAEVEREGDRVQGELEIQFEEVAAQLKDVRFEEVWVNADTQDRRILVEELLDSIAIFPDHLEVSVTNTPPLIVRYQEVGLKESYFVGVGGGT
jgi:site-specific DNA recombinase